MELRAVEREDRVGGVVRLLGEMGHRKGDAVAVAVATEWCLAAGIDNEGLPRKDRRQAMVYRFEEKLPVAAEELFVDFVEGEKHSLGVGVRENILRPILEALEMAGAPARLVAPLTLLATSGELSKYGVDWEVWVIEGAVGVELLTRKEGDLAGWDLLPSKGDVELRLRLLGVTLGRPATVRVSGEVGVDGARHVMGDVKEIAAREVGHIFEGNVEAPVDLMKSARGMATNVGAVKKPLVAACVALSMLMLATGAALLWRGMKYNELAEASEGRQGEMFAKAFPEQTPPAAIRSRLASEELRLRALGGVGGALPAETPTLVVLRDALSALPSGMKFRVTEIRADGGMVQVDGQASSHGEADAIAGALRMAGKFEVEPPRSEQLSTSGVSFSIAGTVRTVKSQAVAGEVTR